MATRAEGVSGHTYLVAKQRGYWRVTYEETPIGAFDGPAEAARFACDVARIEAQAGVPTRVEVQAAVLETHHFVSPECVSAVTGAPRRPRVAR